jgi:glutaredoxin 3
MSNVVIYSKENCPYCVMAKQLLDARKVTYTEIRIDLVEAERDNMIRLSGRRTVPQIFINEKPIGGYDDLAALAKSGKLDDLLNA